MASSSWVVAQSQHALKQRIHSKHKLQENINSRDVLPRRLYFVRPNKECNARPTSSSSTSSSSSPPRPGRTHSDFKAASIQLFHEADIPPLMNWKTSLNSVGAGLRNLGNSCFMNATLQCLCYTPSFQNYIASNQHTHKCKTSGYCIFCQLQKLMPTMLHNQSTAVPHSVFRNLRLLSKKLRPGRQEDAQEFLRFLMEGLQNSCLKQNDRKFTKDMRIQETTFIHKLWGGYLRSQIKCCKCGHESNTYDSILDISLEIKGPSVRSALKHFTDPEVLDDDNKYRCGNCNKKRRAVKQLTIFEPPNILVIHLKRFECGGGGLFSGGKINKYVKFDDTLDITEYMSYNICPKVSYSLFGVLVHYGYSSHGGHYVSYIKAPDDRWYLMDDSRCNYVSNVNSVLKEKAYLLFYQRNEDKVLYETPTHSPNIHNIKTNKRQSRSSLDSLQELANSLPSHSYLFQKQKRKTTTIKESPSLSTSDNSSSPILKPLRDRNIRNRKPLISTDISSDAALEWQKTKKRKMDNNSLSGSPQKKRKIVNGDSMPIKLDKDPKQKQLKLLKQRMQRIISLSSSCSSKSSSSHSVSNLFIGRRSNALRLAATSTLHLSPTRRRSIESHVYKNKQRRRSMEFTSHLYTRRRSMESHENKWKRPSLHGTLSDNSSESVFSDNDQKTASFCDDSSSSRSPDIIEYATKPMNTTLPIHDGSSPRTLGPTMRSDISIKHSNIVPPVHSIKNMKRRIRKAEVLITDNNEINKYLEDKDSALSAVGVGDVGVWSEQCENGKRIRNRIINECKKPIVEPKDEWDVLLDTGLAYVKHNKAPHPFEDFNRYDYINGFQSTQKDFNTGVYITKKIKKKKGQFHNKNRFHSRQRKNVVDA